MNGEFYLDYAELFKIQFNIEQDAIRCILSCEEENVLTDAVLEKLGKNLQIRYDEESNSYWFEINGKTFSEIKRATGATKIFNGLTGFETRELAQGKNKNVILNRIEEPSFVPKTDLHTHFAGAITPEQLIQVGLKHNIKYPKWALKKCGIATSAYNFDENGQINLRDIKKTDLKIMENKMRLTPITQETFNKMEEIYAIRGPFTKNKELFPDYLHELAIDYQKHGVEYVELSFSAFLTDPDYMQMLEDNLPQIEAETGVKIRFLAGFWRHSDKEWNLDDVDRLKSVAKSPYIVGCDFMGHETNQTLSFEDELKMLARYAMEEDPNFAIRVHAGENPVFKTNVYDALKIVYDEHKKMEEETGKQLPMPQVRIGHGLYGLDIKEDGKWNKLPDNEVLRLLKEMGAIVEFNMSSNLALNNINSLSDVPIKKYIDAGVHVVLGTDGHGLYSTFGEQEVLLALAAGLTIEDLEKIEMTEEMVIDAAIQREKTHPRIKDVLEIYRNIRYSTPDGKQRYTQEVIEKYKQIEKELQEFVDRQLLKSGAITDKEIIERDTKSKTPIAITGASESSWPNISPEKQDEIEVVMQVLANTLNPDEVYIVTGGTNFGVEKRMHEAINRRNKNSQDQMVCLGTVTLEAAMKGNEEIQKDTITHAIILELDGRKAKTWMDLPDTQLEYVQRRQGEMIAVGGGSIVNDMIQRGHNFGISMHLMDGPEGASTDKSRSLEGNDYSFESIKELLTRLYNKNPQYFVNGFSLENTEQYIEEARQTIRTQKSSQELHEMFVEPDKAIDTGKKEK